MAAYRKKLPELHTQMETLLDEQEVFFQKLKDFAWLLFLKPIICAKINSKYIYPSSNENDEFWGKGQVDPEKDRLGFSKDSRYKVPATSWIQGAWTSLEGTGRA